MISLLAISLGIFLNTTPNKITIEKTPALPIENQKAADWQISAAHAQEMVNYFKSCSGPGCHSYTKLTKNKAEKREIRKENDIAAINFRLKRIKARYTQADEERYRANRGIKEGDPRGNVAGYTTKLLRVRPKKKHASRTGMNDAPYLEFESFLYYDLESICPPPDPC